MAVMAHFTAEDALELARTMSGRGVKVFHGTSLCVLVRVVVAAAFVALHHCYREGERGGVRGVSHGVAAATLQQRCRVARVHQAAAMPEHVEADFFPPAGEGTILVDMSENNGRCVSFLKAGFGELPMRIDCDRRVSKEGVVAYVT